MIATVRQASNLEIHEIFDGYIVYQTDSDRVHFLNQTAAIIFEFCDGTRGPDEIVARVAKAFELGSVAHDQIRTGLDSLAKEGLILSHSK